ncbi:MAG: hypothetical protein KC441_06205, partial [Anaerolineales bacterium]|nr:hypothetical protein [Anaerolineales bacterium]
IDGGTAVAMNVGTAAPITSLDQTILAAVVNSLTEGVHSVSVRSQDAFGNWGAAAGADLVIDKAGPVTSGVSAAPNPNNGQQPINSGTPAVRVTATLNDTASNIVAAEGFIDTEGTNSTGFVFAAADGQLDSLSEVALSDIPLATINLLPAGNHTIYVHGKDAAGNWGATSSTILLIDKTAPTVSGTAAVPNPTAGSASVTLTATANDASTAVTAAEWFTGADPGVGNGTAMTVSGTGPWSLAATLNVSSWPIGSYTLNVRARDAAGNWSALSSTVLVVSVPPVSFSTLGNTNPPGVGGAADDADLYQWNGTYSRLFDATAAGLPGSANVDAYHRVDATHFYLSFSSTTTFVPGLGNVQDEDVVYYNNGVWSVYFDGTAHGLTSSNEDIDAISIVGSVLYFSTVGNTNPPGVGGFPDDADIYSWNGSSYARVWDASTHGLSGFTDVDGVKVIDATHLYLSFNGTVTNVPGLGFEQDEDLVYYNNGVWSVYFNGTAYGLGTSGNLDIDAFDIP